jgi:tetratricopeptide (TPR) repeat protein
LATVIFAAAVHLLHAVQLSRQSRVFLSRAREARQADKLDEALHFYRLYLDLAPRDVDTRAEYGLFLADLRQYGSAIDSLEEVLRKQDGRTDLRRRVAEMSLGIGRYRDAEDHLQRLLARSKGSADLWELLGKCRQAWGHDEEAVAAFREAIHCDPHRIDSYAMLASLLFGKLDRKEDARRCMDLMVQANPRQVRAHVVCGEHQLAAGQIAEAAKSADAACNLAPRDTEALLLSARIAFARRDEDRARRFAEKAIAVDARKEAAYLLLADIEARAGKPQNSVACLRRGLAATGAQRSLQSALVLSLLDCREVAEAKKTMESLHGDPALKGLLSFAEARIAAIEGRFRQAAEGLQEALPELEHIPRLRASAYYLLGRCYQQLKNSEQQLQSFRRASLAEPTWIEGRLALAATLRAMGRLEEALGEYRAVVAMEGGLAKVGVDCVRLLILRNRGLPAAEQNWAEVDDLVTRLSAEGGRPQEAGLLRAEVLVARGRSEEAERVLAEVSRAQPKEAGARLVRITLKIRQKAWNEVERLLGEAEKSLGDCADLRLARARFLAARDGRQAVPRLRAIAAQMSGLPLSDRIGLWNGLIGVLLGLGEDRESLKLCCDASAAMPGDLTLAFLRFQLAVQTAQEAEVQRSLASIERIEGRGPYWHYAQALRLSAMAETSKNKKLFVEAQRHLAEAQRHLAEVRASRSNWPSVEFLAAKLDDLQGQPQAALAGYLRAIDLGERNPLAIRRATELLYQEHRYVEADKILRKAEQEGYSSDDLDRFASDLSARLEDYPRALAKARKAAASSQDWRDHFWLGQVLAMEAQRAAGTGAVEEHFRLLAEAEQALQQALKLAPASPQPWLWLVRLLVLADRRKEAEALVVKAQEQISLDQRPLAVARCYEVLERFDEAQRRYAEALRAHPEEFATLQNAIQFAMRRGDLKQAESRLRGVLAGTEAKAKERTWSRRALAEVLALQGTYPAQAEAVQLLDTNLADSPSPEDQRMRAMLLASHPTRARRQEAMALLEGLVDAQEQALPEERFALARLYLAENQATQAGRHLAVLASSRAQEPRYVSAYLGFLVQQKELGEAETWLAKLQRIAPHDFATVRWTAELQFRKGQPDQALATLLHFVDQADAKEAAMATRPKRLLAVALALEQLAQEASNSVPADPSKYLQEAERLYRQTASQEPGGEPRLASYLARRGRARESLEILERSYRTAPPSAIAGVLAELRAHGFTSPSEEAMAGQLLQKALDARGRPLELLSLSAEMSSGGGRWEEAERLYREILGRNPHHVMALNNLAMLLALEEKRGDESLRLVEEAIRLSGPQGPLLDTRGMAYLALGKLREALENLEAAIAESPVPVRLFHRAQAYLRSDRPKAAASSLREAMDRGLKPEQLHPLERSSLAQLRKQLVGPGK